jgi:hypothetical protein
VTDLLPGDVLVTRTATGWGGRLIRLGAALLDKSNARNHVVIVHHLDKSGTLWGVEGRPGGIGWVDVAGYAKDRWTLDNRSQPKSVTQRQLVAEQAEALLQRPYDWSAIARDGMASIHADRLWAIPEWADGQVPGHVVCSSYADWLYEKAGLPNPGGNSVTRFTTPADWDAFIQTRAWEATL